MNERDLQNNIAILGTLPLQPTAAAVRVCQKAKYVQLTYPNTQPSNPVSKEAVAVK